MTEHLNKDRKLSMSSYSGPPLDTNYIDNLCNHELHNGLKCNHPKEAMLRGSFVDSYHHYHDGDDVVQVHQVCKVIATIEVRTKPDRIRAGETLDVLVAGTQGTYERITLPVMDTSKSEWRMHTANDEILCMPNEDMPDNFIALVKFAKRVLTQDSTNMESWSDAFMSHWEKAKELGLVVEDATGEQFLVDWLKDANL